MLEIVQLNAKKIISLLMNYFIVLVYRRGKAGGVVLIRLDHIGDFVLWLNTANVYRQLYPNQKITLAANPVWADMAAELSYWDEVISVDKNLFNQNWFYRWKLMRQFRQIGFETAIQPTYSREFLLGDSLVYVTGATSRIGSLSDCINIRSWLKTISDKWYTQLIPPLDESAKELERNVAFISKLSGQAFPISLSAMPRFTQLPLSLAVEQPYCVIFPGASWSGKQWPVAQFAQVAQIISQEQHWRIVICGGPQDIDIGSELYGLLGDVALNFVGRTSLKELIEVIRNSVFVVSNDTSAIHIAAAVETLSVCILGGGHFGRFLPYPDGLDYAPTPIFTQMACFGCNWQCTQEYSEGEAVSCIRDVTVENVLKGIRQKLVMNN